MEIIIDKNLRLRSYQSKDKPALFKNSTDKKFLKFMEYKKFSITKFNSWLKIKTKSKNTIFYVIEYNKQAIGTYVLTISGVKNQICDLSYGISSKHFGKNIFKKTTKKILDKFKNIKRFSAITRIDNVPSIKGLKRLRFKKEGILKSYYYDLKTKKYYDAIILSHINSKN